MKYLAMTFPDGSREYSDRLGYFEDYSLACRYAEFSESSSSRRIVYKVPYSQFLNEYFIYTYSVFVILGKRMRLLGRFDTSEHVNAFISYYSSEFPFVKLKVFQDGVQAPYMDKEQTLF